MNENFCRLLADSISSKQVVIYGAGNFGASVLNIMDILKKKVIYFLDKNTEKQKSGFWGYVVKQPEDILHEDMSKTIVLVAVGAQKEVGEILTSFGLKEGKEFIYVSHLRYQACDALDTLLGYSRLSDINGFYNMCGRQNTADKNLLCLGGSNTDYSSYGIKSWPEFLSEILGAEGNNINVLNGGVVGYNSSQELLKLIRDGLELHPILVISYSGINDMVKLPRMGAHYMDSVWENISVEGEVDSIVLENNFSITHGNRTKMDSAEYWYRNEKIMCNICRGFAIPFLGILQPCTYTRINEEQSLYEKRALYANVERIVKHFEKAKALIKSGGEKDIIDLTTLFDHKEDIYFDTCHVFEQGNEIIAQTIYQIMKERELV